MLDMRRMISLLLAMALLALPALAGATDAHAADTPGDAESGAGESFGDMVSSILASGKDAAQDAADATGETGATPTADAAPAANSLFGSIIDSGKPIEAVPLSQATPEDAQLIQAARGVADSMCKLCTYEQYMDIYVPTDDVRSTLADIVPEYGSAPESIAVMRLSDDKLGLIIDLISITSGIQLTDDAELLRTLRMKIHNMLAGALTLQSDQYLISAAAIATCTDVQRLDGHDSGIAYVLFDYGEDEPAAIVALCIDEDGLTMLTATPCMLSSDLRATLLSGQTTGSATLADMMLAFMSQTVYTPD